MRRLIIIIILAVATLLFQTSLAKVILQRFQDRSGKQLASIYYQQEEPGEKEPEARNRYNPGFKKGWKNTQQQQQQQTQQQPQLQQQQQVQLQPIQQPQLQQQQYCGGYNDIDCSSNCFYQQYTYYQCQPGFCACW